MNELDIYNIIKTQHSVIRKRINILYRTLGFWGGYAIGMLILLHSPLWTSLVIFIPLIPIIYFLVIYMIKIYKLAKKFPLFYNNWKDQDFFIYRIVSETNSVAQTNPESIKIKNEALKYIDNIVSTYKEDDLKLSNAYYNLIIDTNLVSEIQYYEKFKKFKRQMNSYRNQV